MGSSPRMGNGLMVLDSKVGGDVLARLWLLAGSGGGIALTETGTWAIVGPAGGGGLADGKRKELSAKRLEDEKVKEAPGD